jgi:hypothetical protein
VRRAVRPAPAAFLFFGVITGFEGLFEVARKRIVERYGSLHPGGESPSFPFPATRTYGPTMGPDLERRFFVLDAPWPQDALAPVKLAAVEMEESIRASIDSSVERPINIDPGLINDCRIILATTKDHSHRLYRALGIWEEITLVFVRGEYRPLPWTYRDFKNPACHEFFKPFRRELLSRLKSGQWPRP